MEITVANAYPNTRNCRKNSPAQHTQTSRENDWLRSPYLNYAREQLKQPQIKGARSNRILP